MPTEEQRSDRPHRGVPQQGVLALARMHPLKILGTTVGAALLVWGLLFVYVSSPAWANTINVDTLADEQITNTQCSLREAIINANADDQSGSSDCEPGIGGDVISIGVTGTVTLTAELPVLSSNIEIVGPGADQLTVTRPDTAEHFRIFTVTGDTTVVTISGMTISNGNALGLDDGGGGISNVDNGTLTITDSIISGNTANDDGAIRNLGTLDVTNSTLSGNTSNGTAGGLYNDRGATATVSDSTFSGNSAPAGGGIFNSGGTLDVTNSTFSGNKSTNDWGGAIVNGSFSTATVSDSTFSDNSAGAEGGAIRNDGTLDVTNSTFSENSASLRGGGIWQGSATRLTVTNSTFSGNSATEGAGIFNRGGGTLDVTNSTFSENSANLRGGGIFSNTNLSGETTTITNSTISGNTAQTSGGGVFNEDGLTVIEFSTITLNTAPNDQGSGVASDGDENTSTEVLSTIISDNTNTDVDFVNGTTNTFVSEGYNLIGDGNATGAFNKTGDQIDVSDPGLGPLANNGGPTQTHALLSGSLAINAGPPTDGNPACPPPATDQRGVSRPQGSACDVGSFELEKTDTQAPRVVSTLPRNGGEVGPAANIRATFSEDMQEASVINAFKLFRKGSTNRIAATVTYDPATDTATLNPANNLRRGAIYKAVVSTQAKDEAGNRLDQNSSKSGLQQKVWFFEIDD